MAGIKSDTDKFFLFIKALLEEKIEKDLETPVRKFITIYSKFLNRPELMFENIPELLYSEFNRFNVLIDYMDKIDIKNWETIIRLINWAKKLQTMNSESRAEFSAIYQSVFEILSFVSKNHPNGHDFDKMISELIKIPLDKKTFITNLFKWMKIELKIPLRETYIDRRFEEFLFQGLQNRIIDFGDSEYEFQIKNSIKKSINKIINSQEVIKLSVVFRFEKIFKRIINALKKDKPRAYNEIVNLFQSIPHPEISDEAPSFIKHRVMTYTRKGLNKHLKKLNNLIKKEGVTEQLKVMRDKFRDLYIFPHLKNYLVTIAYAINAKSERLRMFINPNLVKLHDFEAVNGHTPWNYSGRPESSLTIKTIPGFRLKGGLSRLNLLFASVWKDQMLAGNIIYDPQLIQSVIYNLTELYPFKKLKYFPEYISLIIDFGLESINNAKTNQKIKLVLLERIGSVLSGYSYRKLSEFLRNKSRKSLLFYSEYYKIGKVLLNSYDCMEAFSEKAKLKKFLNLPLKAEIESEKNRFGNIYYYCLGTLRPLWKEPFPLEHGIFFKSGYYLGEIFREFKMRLAYLGTKKKYPPEMFGHLLFNYMISSFPRFYQQNYDKDIYTTYFIFNIMNNANFKKVFKKYKRLGFVRLK